MRESSWKEKPRSTLITLERTDIFSLKVHHRGGCGSLATITNAAKMPKRNFDWGAITWLCNSQIDPDAQMTFGTVYIKPGASNPRHYHPNCEEYIFVIKGECDHSLDDEVF